MATKRILVIGGTGYIGQDLVHKLIKDKYNITLLVRKSSSRKLPDCKHIYGDLLDINTLTDLKDFDIIINLAAVVESRDKRKYNENVYSIRNLIKSIKGKTKLIHFSTYNVKLKNKGPYSKSKLAAEEIVKKSNIPYVIIRPNYVYGIDTRSSFYKISKVMSKFHVAPIIGDGENKIQPIFKADLINIVCGYIDNFKSGEIIDISGDETLSINEIIHQISDNLGVNIFVIHIPIKLMYLFRRFLAFDINGFDEDRVSIKSVKYGHSSLSKNLIKIVNLNK